MKQRITVPSVIKMKGQTKISALTAYDYVTAGLIDRAGCDIILVGDSLANVVLGHETTLTVSMEDMIRHCAAVARGASHALLVADMPFLSYQVDIASGIANAGRLLRDGNVHAVKLEGGVRNQPLVTRLTEMGIPVMGHIGVTPQSIHGMGGYKRLGKLESEIDFLLREAQALQEAGAFAIVLECLHPETAAQITRSLQIPTIGIGSGDSCDGQILVINDLLGYGLTAPPPFVTPTMDMAKLVSDSIATYIKKVKGSC